MAKSDNSTLLPEVTRRTMLAGAVALPLAAAVNAVPSGSLPDAGPDAELFAAAAEVEQRWQAHYDAYQAWSMAEPGTREWPPELEDSLSALHAAILQLAAMPARTLPGLLVKLRILADDPEDCLYGQAQLMGGAVADLARMIKAGTP